MQIPTTRWSPATGKKTHRFFLKKIWSGLLFVFCNIFEIKFVEMSESAVPAPDDKMPAADSQVVRAGEMAVPAFRRLDKLPEIITADFNILSFFTDILNPGYEDTGSPAVVADYLGLVRHSPDYLIGVLLAVITVRAITRENELFAHER
jgi:hypothetical protein